MGQLDGLLEIHLCGVANNSYDVELRFNDLANQAQNAPVRGPTTISLAEAGSYRKEPRRYGQELSKRLFHDERIHSTFSSAKNIVLARNGRMRVSLVIEPPAAELHALGWELLADPDDQTCISTNEGTPFSRFLYGSDWTGIPLLRKCDLKALIVVPDPGNLEDFGLDPVNAQEEIQRARQALGENIAVTVFDGAATLDAMIDVIAQGFDILYLVCHGALRSPPKVPGFDFESGFAEYGGTGEADNLTPVLYLENADREVSVVSGVRLARRFADLGRRPLPRLVVLASCESAGAQDDWTGQAVQASLAPRLARAGVPALIAMQGKISVATSGKFMQPFFAQLVQHGCIDQAVAAARSRISDEADSWMPVLFLRLKDGRLWYEPSFTPGAKVNFDSISNEIAARKFTPIVGWGLAESIYGSKLDLSERLAVEKLVPLEAHRRGELALVSQYLQVTTKGEALALNAVKERMRREVLERFKGRFSEDLSEASLKQALDAAGCIQRTNENDPYRVVARLPASVFINAAADGLLEAALRHEGKNPLIRTPSWKSSLQSQEVEKLNPDEQNPLILHVFGHFADADSLVLGEDEYLDYLMGVAQNQALMSNAVKHALSNRALLFLGFNVTDWSFRVLFRIVMKLMAGAENRRSRMPNVAVQVEPDGSLFSGAEEARDYLEKFYGPSNIEPFWGTTEDFLVQLWPKVKVLLERRIAANGY
jgi:hypothetical protein